MGPRPQTLEACQEPWLVARHKVGPCHDQPHYEKVFVPNGWCWLTIRVELVVVANTIGDELVASAVVLMVV